MINKENLKKELLNWNDALKDDNIDIVEYTKEDCFHQDMKDWATMGGHEEMIKLLNENDIENTVIDLLRMSKEEVEEFIEDYIKGEIIAVQENLENNSYYGFDYLDEIEDSLKDEYIYTDEQRIYIENEVLNKLEKEYKNVYANGCEQLIPIDGRFETVYNQLVIVK